tara:strand:+ start:7556 stop:8890 length:1335 start_codon:yes stop_codon:yes gene_type:complete
MLNFEEKEIELLRNAVDEIQQNQKREEIKSYDILKLISVVEDFISKKKLICYGGSAINNILPDDDQFYDKRVDIPDYDFFSTNAVAHAKELADIFHKKGYVDIEAKAGVHYGTYKVFVNFIPIADITQMNREVFDVLFKESIIVNNIHYASANFLRMSMYLELSRPNGDVSRWEKVMNRLILLNKHYKLKKMVCDKINVNRGFENKMLQRKNEVIFNSVLDAFISEGVVFFGGFAFGLYTKYMPNYFKRFSHKYLDFDVLSTNANKTTNYVVNMLKDMNLKNVNVTSHKPIGEIIPEHHEIKIGKETIGFVYQSDACYSYNNYKYFDRTIKIASIDTIIYFYLGFQFSDRTYYDKERLVCLAQFLFALQQKNRLKQIGLLKRFSSSCYGTQETLNTIRSKKNDKYSELKTLKKSKNANKKKKLIREYDKWFLKYVPKTKKKPKS